MKKILFGSAAALCAAVGFTSFKSAVVSPIYWFSVNGDQYAAHPSTLPSNVINSKILHPFVESDPIGVAPGLNGCTTGTHLCLVGFTTAQLTAAQKYLRTAAIPAGFQVRTAAYTKP